MLAWRLQMSPGGPVTAPGQMPGDSSRQDSLFPQNVSGMAAQIVLCTTRRVALCVKY